MNFKSLKNLVDDVKAWSEQIDFDYNYIIGVPSSGMLAAHLLSVYTGKPKTVLGDENKTLIVDDSLMSGKTMRWWKDKFPKSKAGTVYVKPGKESLVDTFYQTLAPPRIFEWNLFKSRHLQNTMMDIDGILCRDPTKAECDYGEKMRNFYLSVRPRIIPSRHVGWLVTCRLQDYWHETREWLMRNNIQATQVIMRQSRSQGHGEFKAKVYKNSKSILFIESNLKQAKVIAKLSGKPVLCYETMTML
jgi:orotate phosphoribosyltransferase